MVRAGVDPEGRGPSLTDVLVVFYLLLQRVPIDHCKGTKIPRREGSPIEVGVGFGGPNTSS